MYFSHIQPSSPKPVSNSLLRGFTSQNLLNRCSRRSLSSPFKLYLFAKNSFLTLSIPPSLPPEIHLTRAPKRNSGFHSKLQTHAQGFHSLGGLKQGMVNYEFAYILPGKNDISGHLSLMNEDTRLHKVIQRKKKVKAWRRSTFPRRSLCHRMYNVCQSPVLIHSKSLMGHTEDGV